MTPLLLFLLALALDYGSSWLCIRKGFTEGNPVLRANPLLVATISAGIVIGLGEGFRLAGYSGWETIYTIGTVIHCLPAAWNFFLLAKGK